MAKTRKKRKTKKQQRHFYREISAVLIIFFAILGMAHLGFIGQIINDLVQLIFGTLYIYILLLLLVTSGYFLLAGHMPKLRNRLVLAVLFSVPTFALLLHTWSFFNIAQNHGGIVSVTWQKGIANFLIEPNNNVGGGMLGAFLYLLTYFTVSQWGTYVIIGAALLFILCLLFNITWRDLISGFQLIWQTIRLWCQDIFMGVKEQIMAYQEKRLENKVTEEKQTSKRKTTKTKQGNHIKQKSTESSDNFEIVGPQSNAIAETKDVVSDEANDNQVSMPLPSTNHLDGTNEDEEDAELFDDTELEAITMDAEHENPDYILPKSDLLQHIKPIDQSNEYDIIKENVRKLEATFESFNVDAKVTKANLGPAVTKYEVQPAIGVKVSKIVSLADDIALALAAKDIRIEAPIPGKSFIGIEVPNQDVSLVSFRDSIENQEKTDKLLNVPLGRDISGAIQSADLTKMPHLLIAGSTGSGKSVAINGIIISILMKAKPNEVKLMMIDPKKVELNVYNGIPHLLTPVVTNPRKAAQALNKVVEEMERRYELFATTGQRNIDGYNHYIKEQSLETGEQYPKLPYIVVIVDELADLMMVASKEVEAAIMRLAQMARAAGIHMILATQRPSVDVITGIIKANVPSRIAFAVSSGTDSRTIIDQNGAEKLLGRGDMLFMPMGEGKPIRVQGAFITDEEVEHIVDFVKNQQEANYVEAMMPTEAPQATQGEELDELWDKVLAFVKSRETVSISMLQRQFRIGYNRSARLVDDLENHGYVSPQDGSKPRQVLITEDSTNET